MAVNRGKDFERVIKDAFSRLPGVSVDRLHDQTTGYAGSHNICDFIVYRRPYEIYIECKSIRGNTFPFLNVTRNQWDGLMEKSDIDGVFAGILCWWIDKDVTRFLPIKTLNEAKLSGRKSVRYDEDVGILIHGVKKRIFFDYHMELFLHDLAER